MQTSFKSHFPTFLFAFSLCLFSLALVCQRSWAQDNPVGIETDPLAWLNTSLSCGELTDQIKSRYAPLGKFADLPEGKKEELRKVLEAVCSERFARCNFKNCQKETPPDVDSKDLASEEDLLAQAQAQLRSLMSDEERFQRVRMEEARKKGAQNTWGRISVPEDKRVREEEQSFSPTREEEKALPSARNGPNKADEDEEDDERDRDRPVKKEFSDPPPLIHK